MSLSNPNKVVTEERLNEYHNTILPYLGGMPDVLANKFSRADLYSTDEKMIGRWIDGRPLYQKTFIGTTPSSANTSIKVISYDFSDIDTVVTTHGYVDSRLPIPMYRDAIVNMNAYVNSDKNGIEMMVSNPFINLPFALTLQYTKSTDSPIEIGLDTDYSTTEKIVGTWIDGKPIYQKTHIFASPLTIGAYSWSDTDLSSIGMAQIVKGIGYDTASEGHLCDSALLFSVNGTGGVVEINNIRNTSMTLNGMTVQYTKTTD